MKFIISILLFSSVALAKTVEVTVTNKGFEPARIEANKGEKLTLKITRKAKHSCATEITMPSEKINKKLPLNETVTVEFTPKKKGELAFGCAMDHMIGGVIVVN